MPTATSFLSRAVPIEHVRVAVAVFAVVAALSALSASRRRAQRFPSELTRHVVHNVRHAARLGVVGEQDGNPLVALLHATTALAHVRIARGIMGDADIRERVGCNPEELEFVLDHAQAEAMRRIAGTTGARGRSDVGTGPATGWLGATKR